MTLCFPTIRQILRLPISNGKVLCSPDSLHVMMILRKRKTYTVVLTGVQLSLLQTLILISVYGLFLQVWAYDTVLTPRSRMLTSDPILPGKVPSLAELFSMYRHDIFIIAASPVYLNAVEDDLVKGVAYLPCPIKQLKIASSAAYNGRLKEYVRCGGTRMMKDLNANMTTLNIKHAGMLIHELE